MKFSCRPGCWVLAALHEPQRRLCSLIRRHCFTSGFISVSVYFILENSSPEFCRSLQNQSVIRRVDIHLFLIIFAGVFLGSDFLWESQVTDRENTQQLRHENTRLWKKEMRINQKTKKTPLTSRFMWRTQVLLQSRRVSSSERLLQKTESKLIFLAAGEETCTDLKHWDSPLKEQFTKEWKLSSPHADWTFLDLHSKTQLKQLETSYKTEKQPNELYGAILCFFCFVAVLGF